MRFTRIIGILMCSMILASCGENQEESAAPLPVLRPYTEDGSGVIKENDRLEEASDHETFPIATPKAEKVSYNYMKPVRFEYEDLTITTNILDAEDSLIRKSSAYGARDGIRMDVHLDERGPE